MLILAALQHPAFAQDTLQQAQRLESAGDLKGAMARYVAALQKAPMGSSQDKQLREKIVDLASKLTPPPALPEEAVRHGVRGDTLARAAQSDADRAEAEAEYRAALKLAPWWADAYLNFGLLEQAMKHPGEAASAYALYLRAASNAPDAEQIRKELYAQQALAEKAAEGHSNVEQPAPNPRMADSADTCGGKIAGSWDVAADTVFPAILVMPAHQLFKWEFKSDGPLGGDAFLHGGERRRYNCQGNSYTLDNFFGITLTLSPDGRRLDGECRDLVSAVGGGCRIHAVRKSGRRIAP